MLAEIEPPRPRFRGALHRTAFVVSLPAGGALVAIANGIVARLSMLIYALSLSGLYAASAAFHSRTWSAKAARWMRRLDHSMIFVLIAGTATPVSLLVLDGVWRWALLATIWSVALAGIVLKLSTDRFRNLGAILHVSLGWAALATLPRMIGALPLLGIILLFSGGILYTGGAILFFMRKPDPRPEVFGYHEVWHAVVIAASACHYTLILLLALRT